MRFMQIFSEAICSFTIAANGPLLVSEGSSNRTDPSRPDNCFLTGDVNGERVYVIPGSSIKGVVRSYVADKLSSQETISLFGSVNPSIKSKISFFDAFADMSTVKTDIRNNTAISAIGQGAKGNSLNSSEALIEGSFPARLVIKNANNIELLTVLEALRALDTGELCIGGRKSRGFGMVKINDFNLKLFSGYDRNLQPVGIKEYTFISDAISAFDKDKLTQDTEALHE